MPLSKNSKTSKGQTTSLDNLTVEFCPTLFSPCLVTKKNMSPNLDSAGQTLVGENDQQVSVPNTTTGVKVEGPSFPYG